MTGFKKTLLGAGIAAGLLVATGAVVVYAGVYDVAADVPHTPAVYAVLDTARMRSIAVRADDLVVPANLSDPARIRQGAGNYNAMCTGCHLSPGAGPTELSQGLYPAPPNLTQQAMPAAEAFWVIKHGIKASGMPAWGKSMQDEYIWNMAAFLQELPKLDAAQYQMWVASSGGHSHGGGETGGHSHAEGSPAQSHDAPTTDTATGKHAHGTDAEAPASQGQTHTHADGQTHTHAAPSAGKPASGKPQAPAVPASPSTDAPAQPQPGNSSHQH